MPQTQANNPLHGLTLEKIVTQLVERYNWDGLHARIRVNCFSSDPSIKSSLKFLRKTQWARDKVEALYIKTFIDKDENERLVMPERKGSNAKPYAKKRSAPSKQHRTSGKTVKAPPANVWTMNKPKSD